MRNTKIALAVLALVASTAAMAQATVYGNIDASVAKASGTNTSFDGSGNWGTSVVGLKGSEDLEGGLKASFNVEHGLNFGTGATANGGMAASNTYNRAANVSLAGEFGSVTAGLQISPFITGSLGGYANGNASFYVNSLALGSVSNGGSGVAANGGDASSLATGGFFIPNAVSYSTPSIGGISATVLTQLSNGVANNEYTAGNAKYVAGDLGVGAAYQKRGGTTATEYDSMNVNASYAMGAITLAGGYTKHTVGTAAAVNVMNVGASYAVASNTNVSLQYAQDNSASKKSIINVGAQYNLSKSTSLYATVSQGKNGAGVLYAGGPTYTTGSKTGYAVGITKGF
jgi:predicted porin